MSWSYARLTILALACGLPADFGQEVPTLPVDDWLDADGQVWRLSTEQFLARHQRDGFRPLAQGEAAVRSSAPGMTFLGFKVWEAIVRSEDETIREVTLSLYNRGDVGDLTADEFAKFMGALNTRLTEWAGDKGVTFRDQQRTTAVALQRKAWVKPPHQADLLWSFTAKSKQHGTDAARPEFARVRLSRFDPNQDPRKLQFATRAMPGKPLTAFDLKARVKRAANGDVLIDSVPMVDQGQKGYCAAAVAERILRYYGRQVDQHEIAQMANTSAEGGTGPEEMIKALRRIGSDVGLDVNVHLDFDFKDFEKVINDYNRVAKRADQTELRYKTQIGNTIFIEPPVVVYQQMDADLLKEVRVKRDTAMAQFLADIKTRINTGIPLA